MLLKQSYQNMEIILVNDGFTDCWEENYETFKKKDNEVKVIHKRLCCKFMWKYWSENCIGYDADMAQIDHFIVSDDKIIPRVHTNENHVYFRIYMG